MVEGHGANCGMCRGVSLSKDARAERRGTWLTLDHLDSVARVRSLWGWVFYSRRPSTAVISGPDR